jgi:hypothetical protein
MASTIGLHKEEIRRIVLSNLQVVYHDWGIAEKPFWNTETEPGERRDDPRAFVIALVAALLGGISDAIERNNQAIAAALAQQSASPGRAGD